MTAHLAITLVACFAQVGLTFWATYSMGRARLAVLKSRDVTFSEIAVSNAAWPDKVQAISNNAMNQFETPMLFFAAISLAAALDVSSWAFAVFSVAFVITRIMHHIIHVGRNHLPSRFKMFVLGLGALAGQWIALGVTLVFLR